MINASKIEIRDCMIGWQQKHQTRKAMTRLFVVPTPVVPDVSSLNFHGSLKKRVAPLPPPGTTTLGATSTASSVLDTSLGGGVAAGASASVHYGTLPTPAGHSRTTSEPTLTSHYYYHTPQNLRKQQQQQQQQHANTLNHKRSPSCEYAARRLTIDDLRKFLRSLMMIINYISFELRWHYDIILFGFLKNFSNVIARFLL